MTWREDAGPSVEDGGGARHARTSRVVGWHALGFNGAGGFAMRVRPATVGDLPAVEDLYARVSAAMRGTPYDCTWELGVHPTREGLRESALAGDLFVAVEGRAGDADASPAVRLGDGPGAGGTAAAGTAAGEGTVPGILGAFVLDGEANPAYGRVAWPSGAAAADAAVLHLVTSAPEARGRGVGRLLVTDAARVARERGRAALRLDVFANNLPAFALYRSCGFVDLGVFRMDFDGDVSADAHLMELDLRALTTGDGLCSCEGAFVAGEANAGVARAGDDDAVR